MPARENAFHVEKHANDALHNPPRGGVTHTDREIRAASAALGRDDGAAARRGATGTAPRRGDVIVRDGAVVRVDADRIGDVTRTRMREGRETLRALGDSGERWKTMSRIVAGGTAGGAALREARRAALGLAERRVFEDDGPVVVPASELRFVDGWASNGLLETEKGPAREIDPVKSKRLHVTATIGRKPKRARANLTCDARPSSGFVALSFDANA